MRKLKFKYSVAVILLALYVPFEVIILKYLPVSDKVYSLLRFIPEVFIYLLLIIKITQNLYHLHWVPKTPIDKILLLFVTSAVISIAVNSAPLLLSVIGMRPLFRYIALFYLVSGIDIPSHKIKYLLAALILIGGFQSLLTSYQHFTGISQIFYPRATDLEVAGVQAQYRMLGSGFHSGREQGVGIGTFGDSVLLAIFLVFVTVLSYSVLIKVKIKKILNRLLLAGIFFLSLIGLFFTYSRASVLIAVISVPLILFIEKKIKRLFFIGMMAVILFAAVLFNFSTTSSSSDAYYNPKLKYTNPIANITSIFSQSYVQNNLEHSRGWIIADVGGQLIKSFNLFGYGPSGDESLDRMVKEDVSGPMPFENLSIINDVYWVAMLSYYGFVGLIIFLFLLWRIYKTSSFVYKNSELPVYAILGLSMMVIVILTIPYTFIVRTFAFRPFGFYFWLLAGLVAAEYRRIKSNQSETAVI